MTTNRITFDTTDMTLRLGSITVPLEKPHDLLDASQAVCMVINLPFNERKHATESKWLTTNHTIVTSRTGIDEFRIAILDALLTCEVAILTRAEATDLMNLMGETWEMHWD